MAIDCEIDSRALYLAPGSMSLILPSTYHGYAELQRSAITCIAAKISKGQSTRSLQIGIVNLMPHGDKYELFLLKRLGLSNLLIEPVWIRLNNHLYKSWNHGHLDKQYITWEQATACRSLDGLIITGAPVEHLPFEKVTYWSELIQLIEEARSAFINILGLCWGGFALAHLAGVEKVSTQDKLFGVYPMLNLEPANAILSGQDDQMLCPQSRYARLADDQMENAQRVGRLRLLAYGEEVGYSIFESADHRQLMHLGHPEYNASRLLFETNRDKLRGVINVPRNFNPSNPQTVWRAHGNLFFDRWILSCSLGPGYNIPVDI